MHEYVVEYLQQYREHSTAQHSIAQRGDPCTKQQTKYVPTRVHIKISTPSIYVHACGVRVVFLEHGALGICKSPVCTQNVGPSTTSVIIPIHSSLRPRVAGGLREAPCMSLLVQYVRFTGDVPLLLLLLYCCNTARVLYSRSSKETWVGVVQVVFRMVRPHNTHAHTHTEAPFVAVTKRRP